MKVEEKKEEKKPKKKFWDRVWRKNKLKKTNTVAVLFLRENGIAEPMEIESNQGFYSINGKTYHEDRDCIYTMGKERFPLAIIPEWNVIPIGRKEWEDKDIQTKFSTLQDHVMKGIRHAERVRMGEREEGKFNTKTIIVIGVVVIVVIAVIVGYM